MAQPHFELVSFKLCPYVQRSVIMLKHKKTPFEITYIDLENPPGWFDKISPLGQVPLLKVNRETVLFESAVINEYLDEVVGPQLHPQDPLHKARERAWIEFGNELFRQSYMMTVETDPQALEPMLEEFFADLARVDEVLTAHGPFFRGREFGLVDAAYAPLFMRFMLSGKLTGDPRWTQLKRVNHWAVELIELPEVMESVVPEFAIEYVAYCRKKGSLLY